MAHLNGSPVSVPQQVRASRVIYDVLEAVRDRYGVLLAVKRPRGRKLFLARFYEGNDSSWDSLPTASIVAPMGWA